MIGGVEGWMVSQQVSGGLWFFGRRGCLFYYSYLFFPQQKEAAVHTQTFSPSLSPHSWGSGRSHKY